MKCIVKDCENHSHQGGFIGVLCMPCHTFLTTGKGKYSQLYRNTVAAEREACANVCDSYDVADDVCSSDTAEGIAIAIRARGQG